jgi:formamidopyrimidine-DNA glycosylase
MPELPEVEVICRYLAPQVAGRRIREVIASGAPRLFLTPPAELAVRLNGRTITGTGRRGKYLWLAFDDGSRLLLHLGMTGQLFLDSARSVRLLCGEKRGSVRPNAPRFVPDGHTHLRLCFDDRGPDAIFRDTRKFGKVLWLPSGSSDRRLDKLGPDALCVTGSLLFASSRGRKVAIKTMLMDQTVLAGVGNIYADEALFRARVPPVLPAASLTRAQAKRLSRAILAVLKRSIAAGGSSISDYIQPDGADGAYQEERLVYGRKGAPCPRCRTAIARQVLGGRGSYYCPACQK